MDGVVTLFRSPLLDLLFFIFELRRVAELTEAGDDSTIGGGAAATGAADSGTARGADMGLSRTSFGTRATCTTEDEENRESVNSPFVFTAEAAALAAAAC